MRGVPRRPGGARCTANGTVDLAWGPLATKLGAAPAWDRAQATCASTYCHGAKLRGRRAHDAQVDGGVAGPDLLRLLPRRAAASAAPGRRPRCSGCHPDTVRPDGSIDLAGGHHIDGKLDVTGECGACHGVAAPERRAPRPRRVPDARASRRTAISASSRRTRRAAAPPTSSAAATATRSTPRSTWTSQLEVELSPAGAPAARCARGTRRAPRTTRRRTVQRRVLPLVGPAGARVRPRAGLDLRRESRLRRLPRQPAQYPSAGAGAAGANCSHRAHRPGARVRALRRPRRSGAREQARQRAARWGAAPITCQACHFATTDPASRPGPPGSTGSTPRAVTARGRRSRPAHRRALERDAVRHVPRPDGARRSGAARSCRSRHVNGRRDVVFDHAHDAPVVRGAADRAGHADAPVLGHAVEVLRGDPGRRRHRGRDALASSSPARAYESGDASDARTWPVISATRRSGGARTWRCRQHQPGRAAAAVTRHAARP